MTWIPVMLTLDPLDELLAPAALPATTKRMSGLASQPVEKLGQ
jgi:hypothetical protein